MDKNNQMAEDDFLSIFNIDDKKLFGLLENDDFPMFYINDMKYHKGREDYLVGITCVFFEEGEGRDDSYKEKRFYFLEDLIDDGLYMVDKKETYGEWPNQPSETCNCFHDEERCKHTSNTSCRKNEDIEKETSNIEDSALTEKQLEDLYLTLLGLQYGETRRIH